ncbi:pilus assembly protein [Thermodesulfobacteriota bacterium]
MKKTKLILSFVSFFICSLIFMGNSAHASGDSCMFEVTEDQMPPKIVLYLDNGVEMTHAVWHADFDNDVDFTPLIVGEETDVVPNGAAGNGFFNENGYGIFQTGGSYYLVPAADNLELIDKTRFQETGGKGSATWTINGKTITLPTEASAVADSDGIKDNAGFFRYSKNYLNWLFFYKAPLDLNGDSVDETVYDDTALSDKSRLYYAKKALLTVGKLSSNKALFGIYNFSNDEGSSNVQGLDDVVESLGATPEENILNSDYINNINNMGTVLYSPLAEGLAIIGGDINSSSFGTLDSTNYCERVFVIVISTGYSSEDATDSNQAIPDPLKVDHDQDGTDGFGNNGPGQGTLTVDGTGHTILTRYNGSTYLDDVAHYFFTHDMRVANDNMNGWQNVMTYTVGFMASAENRVFLINTSNNGNGNPNLTNSSHPEYGKYHFEAKSATGLSQAILDAVNAIISRPATFVAPVVPVTRTTSGDKIYMAFFIPTEENFWEGYVNKFSLNAQNEIIDANGNAATWANGAMREEAVPLWSTNDWANTVNTSRNIYTYLGTDVDLTADDNEFDTTNSALTDLILGYPTDINVNGSAVNGRDKVINYVRGADVLDQNEDTDTGENRDFITGDVLHSEPVVFTYRYADNTTKTMVFFGSNDGMLHAVLDETDPDINTFGDEASHGTEAWSFIPPDQLIRLKYLIEGTSHKEFVDSSPKIYFHDEDEDGMVDPSAGDKVILVCGERRGGSSYFGLDVTVPESPIYMWRIGSGNENTMIKYDNQTLAVAVSSWVGDLTTAMYNDWMSGDMTTDPFAWGQIVSSVSTGAQTGVLELANIMRHAGGTFQNAEKLTLWDAAGNWDDAAFVVGYELVPDVFIPELGESWSVPQFGLVKTTDSDTDGTAVFFIGGGYSEYNSAGRAVVAVNVFTGEVVRKFTDVITYTTDTAHTTDTNIYYSVPSTVKVIDEDNNGFVDKIYVGDLGGQLWRFGQVSVDSDGNTLSFPDSDENINNWTGQILFRAPTYVVDAVTYTRKFFYPPSVTLEHGYDLIFIGTGDREAACDTTTGSDRIYSVKDTHGSTTLTEADLVDVTDPFAAVPNLDLSDGDVDVNGQYDQGWYIRLVDQSAAAVGEKVLGKSTVFYKTLYISTFTPNNHPCLPGGEGRLYAVNYKTGRAVLFLGGDIDGDGNADLTRSVSIGGGIPSKPVMVIKQDSRKILISIGSTTPEATSEILDAGIVRINPLEQNKNFFIRWWRQLFG